MKAQVPDVESYLTVIVLCERLDVFVGSDLPTPLAKGYTKRTAGRTLLLPARAFFPMLFLGDMQVVVNRGVETVLEWITVEGR